MTMGGAQNDNGGALGVLVPDNTNPYNALVLKGVEAKAQEAGHIVIIANTNSDAEREKEILNSFVSMKLAGILSIPTWLENYCERNVPFILMSRFPYHEPYISRVEHKIRSRFSYIVNDDFLGEYMAAAHLIRQGYRDLYLVLGSTDKSNAEGIIGYDDIDSAKYMTPPLTTINQSKFAIGSQSVAHLINSPDGPGRAWQKVLAPSLCLRRSTKNIKAGE